MPAFGNRVAIALAFVLASAGPVSADVDATLEVREYPVAGTTPRTLVASMRAHPLQGAHGTAVANIRADQTLRVSTRIDGAKCIADTVLVQIRFVMTLPRAVHANAMTPKARAAWAGFAAFARRHEEGHKTITLQCARRFEAQARGLGSEAGCQALEVHLAALFGTSNAACARLHTAYDRAEAARLRALPFMRAAQ